MTLMAVQTAKICKFCLKNGISDAQKMVLLKMIYLYVLHWYQNLSNNFLGTLLATSLGAYLVAICAGPALLVHFWDPLLAGRIAATRLIIGIQK